MLVAKVGALHRGVADDAVRRSLGDLLARVEDRDALGEAHDRSHDVLDHDHGGVPSRRRESWRTGHRRWPRRWTPTTPLHSAPELHPGATDAEACSLASWFLARPKSVDRPLSALYPGGAEPSVDQSRCDLEGQASEKGPLCLLRSLMVYSPNTLELERRAATYVDPQGREARRLADRAAHQLRPRHQPQDRQCARPDDPTVAAAARGPSNRIGVER